MIQSSRSFAHTFGAVHKEAKKRTKETLNRTAVRLIRNSYVKLFLVLFVFFFAFCFSLFATCSIYLATVRRILIFWISVSDDFFGIRSFRKSKHFTAKMLPTPYTTLLTQTGSLVAVRYHDWMIIFMLCFPFLLLRFNLSVSLFHWNKFKWNHMRQTNES